MSVQTNTLSSEVKNAMKHLGTPDQVFEAMKTSSLPIAKVNELVELAKKQEELCNEYFRLLNSEGKAAAAYAIFCLGNLNYFGASVRLSRSWSTHKNQGLVGPAIDAAGENRVVILVGVYSTRKEAVTRENECMERYQTLQDGFGLNVVRYDPELSPNNKSVPGVKILDISRKPHTRKVDVTITSKRKKYKFTVDGVNGKKGLKYVLINHFGYSKEQTKAVINSINPKNQIYIEDVDMIPTF